MPEGERIQDGIAPESFAKLRVYASNEPRIGKIRTVIGSLLTNHGFYFCRDAANALLYPSSVAAWAQMTGASFSVPFFRRSVGTGDRGKLLCTLLLPQRGHR